MLEEVIPPVKYHEFPKSQGEQVAEFEPELRAPD